MEAPNPTAASIPEATNNDPRPTDKRTVVGKCLTTTGRAIRYAAPVLPLFDVVAPVSVAVSLLGGGMILIGGWLGRNR
jgi:hypothetical protein